MNLNEDKKLLKFAFYIVITVISIYIGIVIISNIGSILSFIFSIFSNIFSLIKPLIIALIITYLLYPIRNSCEKFLKNNKIHKITKPSKCRILSTIFSYFFVLSILIALLYGIYFMIGGQLSNNATISNIVSQIIDYINENKFSSTTIKETINNLNIPFLDMFKPYLLNIASDIQHYVINNIDNMTSSILSFGSSIASFFVGLVISIYLLKDTEYFIALWKKIYNIIFRESKLGKNITKSALIIHEVFSKFIRGQLLEAFFVGILSSIALAIIGLNYSFVIGPIAGICNMIPYVGPVVGTVLAVIIALLSGSPIKVVYAIIAMIVVQQIDNNLLAPKIVGDSVGLHPVFTMLAILIGANVGGFLGMLFSVPLIASFKIFFNIWYDKHIAAK